MKGGDVFAIILVVGLLSVIIMLATGGKGIVIEKPNIPHIEIVNPE